jgi:6-pyruvoyltetrahydropterin/6-carboxytetrahydropterin synthase
MYSIAKELTFDSAHKLPLYEGKCENLHGHTYRVLVEVAAPMLLVKGPCRGMVADFGLLKEVITERFDHKYLNEIHPFSDEYCPPTAENLAQEIYKLIQELLLRQENDAICVSVVVWETPTSMATYRPDRFQDRGVGVTWLRL